MSVCLQGARPLITKTDGALVSYLHIVGGGARCIRQGLKRVLEEHRRRGWRTRDDPEGKRKEVGHR